MGKGGKWYITDTYIRMPVCHIHTNYIHNVYNVVIVGVVCRKRAGGWPFADKSRLSLSLSLLLAFC